MNVNQSYIRIFKLHLADLTNTEELTCHDSGTASVFKCMLVSHHINEHVRGIVITSHHIYEHVRGIVLTSLDYTCKHEFFSLS